MKKKMETTLGLGLEGMKKYTETILGLGFRSGKKDGNYYRV